MQHVGIILTVDNPILVINIKNFLNKIDGVKVIYITIRNNKKLYIVDEEGGHEWLFLNELLPKKLLMDIV